MPYVTSAERSGIEKGLQQGCNRVCSKASSKGSNKAKLRFCSASSLAGLASGLTLSASD